jgi:hypothetical protein
MMDRARSQIITVLIVAAPILGGCAGANMPSPAIETVPPGDERIVFTAAEFKGMTPQRVKYTDFWQREEYALFRGSGAQAEIIYASANEDDQIALEYGYTVEGTIKTWNLNKKFDKEWGAVRTVEAPLRGIFYKPYMLKGKNRECFGFSVEWDDPSGDPDHRPGKVLFGYFCAQAGEHISEDGIEELIQRIGVRGVTERLGSRRGSGGDVAPASADAVMIARGPDASSESGNANFPFGFARYYIVGNGDGRLK